MSKPTLYRIDLSASFDIRTEGSWCELLDEAKDEGLLVPVEPTHGVCVTHDHLEIEGRGFCIHGTESDIGDGTYEWDCEVVDAWLGEPA